MFMLAMHLPRAARRGFALLMALLLLLGLAISTASAAATAATGPVETTPTATPPLKTVQFTAGSIERTAPDELIQRITLHSVQARYPGCMNQPETPSLNYMPGDRETMDIAMVSTCGWEAGELVQVAMRDPTGKVVTSQVKAVPSRNLPKTYEVTIYFQPPVDAPEGKYRWTFTGQGGEVKAKIQYDRPKEARLYVLPADSSTPAFGAFGPEHDLLLYGFKAEEPVRLFAYRVEGETIQFYGWQDYTTDRLGQLNVAVDLGSAEGEAAAPGEQAAPEELAVDEASEFAYYAYARETHFVAMERFDQDGFSASDPFVMDLYCPGAQTPRLQSGQALRSLLPAGAGLKIYQQPGFGSRVTITAAEDAEVTTYGLPVCIDRAFWWKVALRQPVRFGWVAEAQLGKYLVEAVEE